MALRYFNFQEAVALVSGATKENPANITHTWWGWVSKGVLHVMSTSGARCREIWHFGLDANRDKRLVFKNTTGAAYLYVRSGATTPLEELLSKIDGSAKVEKLDSINVEFLIEGKGCPHLDGYHSWYTVLTDGNQEMVRKAPLVGDDHPNQYHANRCPDGESVVRVTNATWAVQICRHKWSSIPRVIITPGANEAEVISAIRKHWGWPES